MNLTASNGDGLDKTVKTNYITVEALTPPVADFTGSPTSGKEPLDVSFTDASTNSPTTWYLGVRGTDSTSTDQNPSHTYTAGPTQ